MHSTCRVASSRHLRTRCPVLIALAALTVGMAADTATAQPRGIKEGDILAPELSPFVCKATAVKQDDAVVIRMTYPETVLTSRAPDDDNESKGWVVVWTEGDPLTLGTEVRAYRQSGEKLEADAVLKSLAQPTAVACFERRHKDDPFVPDPFYTAPFREDVVILVYDGKYWLRE